MRYNNFSIHHFLCYIDKWTTIFEICTWAEWNLDWSQWWWNEMQGFYSYSSGIETHCTVLSDNYSWENKVNSLFKMNKVNSTTKPNTKTTNKNTDQLESLDRQFLLTTTCHGFRHIAEVFALDIPFISWIMKIPCLSLFTSSISGSGSVNIYHSFAVVLFRQSVISDPTSDAWK